MADKEVIKNLQSRFEELQRISKAWGAASGDVAHAARFDELASEAIQACRAALAEQDSEPVIGDEWTPCVKLPVAVHVRKQREGETHVSTREGITPVKPDDLIMRGVSGEEYPIGREIFESTYRIGKAPQPAPAVQDSKPAFARLLHWIGDEAVYAKGKTIARTYEECPENTYTDAWQEGAKLYTPQQAPAVQPLTDEQIDRITIEQWGDEGDGVIFQAHRAYARAVLKAAKGIV